ncbi:MAG: BrnT family toxin [Nitrosomonas sp.]|nr:MAG: BrnT family toxin [Nitrosomonas sp.]
MCGIGYIGLRLFFVVFIDRKDARRIISLRKTNKWEIQRYAET